MKLEIGNKRENEIMKHRAGSLKKSKLITRKTKRKNIIINIRNKREAISRDHEAIKIISA